MLLDLDGSEGRTTCGAESNSSKSRRRGKGSKYKKATIDPVIPKAIIGHNRPGERLALFFLRVLFLGKRDLNI
ncbi:MAG: hypothetical protein JRI27_05125 [Deltaproteobacteria bacterium]|nr:hypothetical protein [Deltaproteobacteria bacterium]